MLFKDVNWYPDQKVKKHLDIGLYNFLKNDWSGIITISQRKKIYLEDRLDLSNVGDEHVLGFVERNKNQIYGDDKPSQYFEGEYSFSVVPLRRTERYVVVYIFSKKNGSFHDYDLQWLHLYMKLSVEHSLLFDKVLQKQKYIENIFNSSESAILVMDLEGKIVMANHAVTKIFGLSDVDGFVSQHYLDIVLPERVDEFNNTIEYVITTGKKRHLREVSFINRNADRILNVVVSPFLDSKGKTIGVVLVGTDITERSISEYETAQTQRYVALDELVTGIDHGIKNPLMRIRGCAKILESNHNFDETDRNMLDTIINEVDRINDLIRQMISIENATNTNSNTFISINDIVRNCIKIINIQKNVKQIEVTYNLDPNLPYFKANNAALYKIILNLLIDLVQTTREKGDIEISTQFIDNKHIRLRIAYHDASVDNNHCSISDDSGFVAEVKNSNLGLFAARRLLAKYNGTIDIFHKEGGETEITINIEL